MDNKNNKDKKIYDLIILGAGPAGVAAGVYAGRKKINSAIITDSFGGQAVVAAKIDNIPGHPFSISGAQMASNFKSQLENSGTEIILDRISLVEKNDDRFNIRAESGKNYLTKTILVCLGSKYKDLKIPGEEKFKGRGIAYCSTCDAPLFSGKDVAVIGGGNTAFNSAIDLLPYANKIYILIKNNKPIADKVSVEEIKKEDKVEIIFEADTKEIVGDELVSGIKYFDKKYDKEKELAVGGVFVNIGMDPKTTPIRNLIKINKMGQIETMSVTGRTSQEGIWAAGDITDLPSNQIITAMGDGVRAVLDIYDYLRKNSD